jgi:ectoine hydroxylase-related dioxygenase (phytanoyl-CoA dioxygenase family)
MYTTVERVIKKDVAPFDADKTRELVAQFHRDGYLFLKGILTAKEVDVLRELMERKFQDPKMHEESGDHIRGISMMRMYEYDINFRDLITREPVASLAEAILGDDCHMMSQNALRYEPGQGGGWHVDDRVHFPLPDDIPRHDARLRLPCFVLNALFPLSRVDDVKYGVTEVVPGSHYSGRRPADPQGVPEFDGQGPVSLLGEPGDMVMFHNQVWHRGRKNISDQVRYVGSVVYSQRVIAQRLYPFIDYRMPDDVWQGADERLQRFLGRHKKGAYG